MKTALMVVLVAAAACGGTAKPDSTAKPAEEGQGAQHQEGGEGHMGEGHAGKHEKGEMAAMPPQLTKFHDTLAPRWHAKHGPQRMVDTCAAMAQFHADAGALATSQAPSGGDAASWSTRGKQLTESVGALDATCRANDAVAFEPAFERVHSTFHGLMEAAGGHHKEHGKEQGEHKH